MSFMLRSGAATGAAEAAAGVGEGDDAAGAGDGPAISELAAAAVGSVDDGELACVGAPPQAANEDNPTRTAPATALRYVQACMVEDSTPRLRSQQIVRNGGAWWPMGDQCTCARWLVSSFFVWVRLAAPFAPGSSLPSTRVEMDSRARWDPPACGCCPTCRRPGSPTPRGGRPGRLRATVVATQGAARRRPTHPSTSTR